MITTLAPGYCIAITATPPFNPAKANEGPHGNALTQVEDSPCGSQGSDGECLAEATPQGVPGAPTDSQFGNQKENHRLMQMGNQKGNLKGSKTARLRLSHAT